jgi:peptidoglycan/LPS O-acetylase OafA/YrhL
MITARAGFRDIVARQHLPALDGLRALAVFTVIVGHANYPIRGVPSDLGVSAFFVLSGFLITRLLVNEMEETQRVSLRNFYLRRTMRIFPAYYVFLLLSFLLDARHGQHWSPALLGSAVTYTVNYFNALHHHPSTSVAHAWSLAVEEQFYLLWPLLFIVLAKEGRRALIVGVSVFAFAAVAWRSWLALVAHADVSYLYNAFDTRFDNLAIGCVLALAVDNRRVVAVAERLGRTAWFPVMTIAILLFSRLGFSGAYHYSVGFTIDALLIAVLIVQLMQLCETPLWSWLERPMTRYLGTISYPIYLYHAWGASVGARMPLGGRGGTFVAGVLATIVLASGSYYVIERPFLKLKRRLTRASRLNDAAPSGRSETSRTVRPGATPFSVSATKSQTGQFLPR